MWDGESRRKASQKERGEGMAQLIVEFDRGEGILLWESGYDFRLSIARVSVRNDVSSVWVLLLSK